MDNSPQLWLIVVTSGASVISVLVLFIRALMTERKSTNGNGYVKQSADCWKQHEMVLSAIAGVKADIVTQGKDISQIQKTLDDRQAIFEKVDSKLDSINLTVHSTYKGIDRRK